jgi:hypothetical protein
MEVAVTADIQAAITYAADTLAHEESVLMEPKGQCALWPTRAAISA